MTAQRFNLSIETSGHVGSFALGAGDVIVEVVELAAKKSGPAGASSGGASDLLAQLEALCRRRGVTPGQIDELYLSIGPGSFTGLRVGVTIAKMLAKAGGTRIVAVPTLDVLVQNVPRGEHHAAACLNLKKETVYCGVFGWRDGRWRAEVQAGLRTMSELLALAPRPLRVVGDPLPAFEGGATPAGVTVMTGEAARARVEAVFALGREEAKAGWFADPMALTPLYVRPPEAVELWEKRHGVKG